MYTRQIKLCLLLLVKNPRMIKGFLLRLTSIISYTANTHGKLNMASPVRHVTGESTNLDFVHAGVLSKIKP
jgi:hypothetical protein